MITLRTEVKQLTNASPPSRICSLVKAVIFNMPRKILKFLLNSVLDTLPTNTNLALWNKRVSESCKLCGARETLGHVLNGCKIMLDQQRYTWRHNNVLKQIENTVDSIVDGKQFEILSDLPGKGHYTIPPDIVPTNERPDLVILDRA